MALTPEDVVNKRFQPTKFREGYDQDEVDDFLDEVVVELRRLNQENEELRQRLIAAESRAAAGPQAAPQAAPVVASAPEPHYAQPLDASAMDPGNTNNLLQLARRLHEEHVREGMEKRDQLIAEAHAQAARIVSEAEQSQRSNLGQLEQERVSLERKIDELRAFERDYRDRLKGYIEGQLRELETSNALTPASVAAPAPAASAPAAPSAAAPQQAYPTPQGYPAPSAAPQGYPAPSPDYSAYPQPTEYPGFGGN